MQIGQQITTHQKISPADGIYSLIDTKKEYNRNQKQTKSLP